VVPVPPGYVNLISRLTRPHLDAMPTESGRDFWHTCRASRFLRINRSTVRLERGAEIDGAVAYDDGSPAIGLRVSYKLKTAKPEDLWKSPSQEDVGCYV
jgi:hypothetical protein